MNVHPQAKTFTGYVSELGHKQITYEDIIWALVKYSITRESHQDIMHWLERLVEAFNNGILSKSSDRLRRDDMLFTLTNLSDRKCMLRSTFDYPGDALLGQVVIEILLAENDQGEVFFGNFTSFTIGKKP